MARRTHRNRRCTAVACDTTIDTSPRFVAVDLEAQLLPGTLEHALNHLLDHEIDLSGFDARLNNDDTGASAYAPGMLLKVVLLAYSRGIVSSRAIERACRGHETSLIGKLPDKNVHTQAMKQRIDSAEGRALYGRLRFAVVEPVLANLRHDKRLNRFTPPFTSLSVRRRSYCLSGSGSAG